MYTKFNRKEVAQLYYDVIHKSIEFIEDHLDQPLSLENVSKEAGFSKFHFHRIFKKYVGKSLIDYIRYRRISSSAQMLLYTNERILDIALYFNFESQEAFTRAFKSIYALPPAQYRSQMKNLLKESEDINMSEINGWMITGTNPDFYQATLDTRVYHKGQKSARFESKEEIAGQAGQFGTFMQQFRSESFAGKRMRFSGFVKSENVAGWAGLWMRVDDHQQNMLAFDNMQDRAIKGTTDWNYYACVLDVPKEAEIICIGILMTGTGTVWIDDCQFEEVGMDIPVTGNFQENDNLPSEPQNLQFEV